MSAVPLLELFLDLPHPAASKSCPPPVLIALSDALDDSIVATLPQIARFAFPEVVGEVVAPPTPTTHLNRNDRYLLQVPGFQHFTFTLQVQSGQRLQGHVRRYLPHHALGGGARYDVGRRGERALIILTKHVGADTLYAAMLKSVEAITSLQVSLRELQTRPEPQKYFLQTLAKYHQHLAHVYASKPVAEKGKPLIAVLEGLETGLKGKCDLHRFIIPTSLLNQQSNAQTESLSFNNSILPLLRCVGVAHALRILAALLSERRVILQSASPTRLATCSHAALAMLAQGMLVWQHLYIPVLPPHLWQYLAAPYPYLIGILAPMAPKLDQTDGLGEVLMIQLDSNTMETRGMDSTVIASRLPDLFLQSSMSSPNDPNVPAAASASEYLAQDLVEILKTDKRLLYGDTSAFPNMGETAARAKEAVKNTFFKLRDRGRQYLQARSGSLEDGGPDVPADVAPIEVEGKSLAPDYVYTEGCHNETSEEDARVAFATFFLCMYGNMRWYLTANPGEAPALDRNRYLQQKRAMGDGEGTPMWPLLQNFCQTQMLEEFAKARIEEIRVRQEVTPDAPIFLQCANYHRQHNIDFGILSVRRISQQVSEANPGRVAGLLQTNARRNAMTLTSNKNFEGDYGKAVAQLVEQCRESTSILFDVMSVIWLRLRSSKGMQWKHAYQGLRLLHNLLLHGPLAAITEATDGLDMIRALKFYENIRPQPAQQVRACAEMVYDLLVDRAKLFVMRRYCAQRRRELAEPVPRPGRDRRMILTAPFRHLHAVANPTSGGTVVALPPEAPGRTPQMDRGGPSRDLLGMSTVSEPPVTQVGPSVDLFGATPATSAQPAPSASGVPDVLGLFDNLAVTTPVASASQIRDPFAPRPPQGRPDDPFAPQSQNAYAPQPQTSYTPETKAAYPPPPSSTAPRPNPVTQAGDASRVGSMQPGTFSSTPVPTFAQTPGASTGPAQAPYPPYAPQANPAPTFAQLPPPSLPGMPQQYTPTNPYAPAGQPPPSTLFAAGHQQPPEPYGGAQQFALRTGPPPNQMQQYPPAHQQAYAHSQGPSPPANQFAAPPGKVLQQASYPPQPFAQAPQHHQQLPPAGYPFPPGSYAQPTQQQGPAPPASQQQAPPQLNRNQFDPFA